MELNAGVCEVRGRHVRARGTSRVEHSFGEEGWILPRIAPKRAWATVYQGFCYLTCAVFLAIVYVFSRSRYQITHSGQDYSHGMLPGREVCGRGTTHRGR